MARPVATQLDETPITAVLVGRRCEDNVNLGLGYLAAALAQVGLGCRVLSLDHWSEMESICAEVARLRPLVVGLSIADGGSAFLPLGLGALLRRRGFAGHLTCGGQFATLARHWLLERSPWLDSVVRHAGEVPLVGLCHHLRGGAAGALPGGITTRQGDGAAAPVLDPLPLTLVPKRDELPRLLGHAVAHVAATRGCAGRCSYCAPAAQLRLERQEARRSPLRPASTGANLVAGGIKRRALDAVCDELATLYRDGVRYAYFVDEHLLPYDEGEALHYLEQLRRGLRRRGVRRLGWGAMLRADRITVPMLQALAHAGAVRLFIGLEFGSDAEARSYGRPTDLSRAAPLLAEAARLGIATISNLMLVHPEATTQTLEASLRFVASLPRGLCELNQMMVYHGTRLHERLAKQGRLTGNPLRYGYALNDAVTARFEPLFCRLRAEVFHDYSLTLRSHDAALSLALARRLGLRGLDAAAAQLDVVCDRVRSLQLRAFTEALELARDDADEAGADALISETRPAVRQLMVQLRAIDATAQRAAGTTRAFSPMRAAARAALTFVVVASTACTSRSLPRHDGATDGGGVDALRCTPAVVMKQRRALEKTVKTKTPCFSGTIGVDEQGELRVRSNWSGQLTSCGRPHDAPLRHEEEAVKEALAGLGHDCFVSPAFIGRWGERAQQERRMQRKLTECTEGAPYLNALVGIEVVLSERGIVTDVRAEAGQTPSPEAIVCVKQALLGLVFPCLANYKVCPSFVIVE